MSVIRGYTNSTVEITPIFISESKHFQTCNVMRTRRLQTKQLFCHKKTTFCETNQKKRLQFANEHNDWTLEQCIKSAESRLMKQCTQRT